MVRPLRQYREFLSQTVAARSDCEAAQARYEREAYAEALAMVEPHVAGVANLRVCQDAVPAGEVLALYCWCLYQLKRFDELTSVFGVFAD